jgi:hypothetical protein
MLISKSKISRADYKTHLKYIKTIRELSNGLKLNLNSSPKISSSNAKKLDKKIQLAQSTKKSIDQEYSIVCLDKDYSMASVFWLPIKVYYAIFHLLCIIDCITKDDTKSLTSQHWTIVNIFTEMLRKKELSFSEDMFNNVYDRKILNFKTKSGEILKNGTSNEIIYKALMRKVAKDKIENYKITKGLSARKKADKEKIEKFTDNLKVSIFDYFYLMRLRTNYRNLDFISDIPSTDTGEYFNEYYFSATSFYKSIGNLINSLLK